MPRNGRGAQAHSPLCIRSRPWRRKRGSGDFTGLAALDRTRVRSLSAGGQAPTNSRRSPEELARLGSGIFDQRVRPTLAARDDGSFVAIDVQSGDFVIDDDDYAAVTQLRSRNPAADIWLTRAGFRRRIAWAGADDPRVRERPPRSGCADSGSRAHRHRVRPERDRGHRLYRVTDTARVGVAFEARGPIHRRGP